MSLSVFATEGLLRVARLLQNLPDEQFDLSSWQESGPCGTTYCAMGFAASTDWFQQRGLYLDRCGGIELRQEGLPLEGFEAVAKFFQIKESQAEYLFMPTNRYSSRKQVIKRIRKFVVRDGQKGGGPLTDEEKAQLDALMTRLDAGLTLEKAVNDRELLRKTLSGDQALVVSAG